jgi:putative transposase
VISSGERHAGTDTALLGKRVEVYEAAKALYLARWSGNTRNWQRIDIVHLNPDQNKIEKEQQQN